MVKAWFALRAVHRLLANGGFEQLRAHLQTGRDASGRLSDADVTRVWGALQHACTLYVRRSTCLHRSAALVRLLRAAGCEARLVFGVQFEPYRGHAWVQVGDRVVNDDPRVTAPYVIVDTM